MAGVILGVVAAIGLAMGLANNNGKAPWAKQICTKLKGSAAGCFAVSIPRGNETPITQAATQRSDKPKRAAEYQVAGSPLGSRDERRAGSSRLGVANSTTDWLLEPAAKVVSSRKPRAHEQSAGTYAVQVGAYLTRQRAKRGWRTITRSAHDLLEDLPQTIVEADSGAGKSIVYRLRAGPLASQAAGRELCAKLGERGIACFVVAPARERNVPEAVIQVADRASGIPASGDLVVALEPDAWRKAAARPLWHWQRHQYFAPRPSLPSRAVANRGTRAASSQRSNGGSELPRTSKTPRRTKLTALDVRSSRARVAMSDLLYRRFDSLSGRQGRDNRPSARRHQSARSASQAHRSRAGYGPRNLGDPSSQIASIRAGDEAFARPIQSARVLTAQSQKNEGAAAGGKQEIEDESRLSDETVPFMTEGDIPDRPPLLLEIGDPFLDTGELDAGFELPTGAVWQPRLWVFGTLRTAVQTTDTGDADRISEWVNRLDLFANLQLTGTEKVVVGIRPFDENQPDDFSGYRFEPSDDEGFKDDLNVDIRTLFAEGDFGSLFPAFDPEGQSLIDFGFTVGRQPLIFQDGILISDTVDAAGLARNNIRLPGVSNLRVAGVYGWDGFDETTRSAGGVGVVDDENLQLAGLFTEWDLPLTTINLDGLYVWDDTQRDGDGIYAGISAAQRIGELNTTFRVNGSLARRGQSALVRDGILLSSELSWTPYGTNDTTYFNPFVAFGEFLQAAREEIDGGGPLAPLGILFASPNIGEYGSEMVNRANDVAGVALGYQAFWDDNRRNLALEFAFRKDLGLDDGFDESLDGFDQYGIGFQLQQAIGQRMLFQLEGYGVLQEDRDEAYGGRAEFLYQF